MKKSRYTEEQIIDTWRACGLWKGNVAVCRIRRTRSCRETGVLNQSENYSRLITHLYLCFRSETQGRFRSAQSWIHRNNGLHENRFPRSNNSGARDSRPPLSDQEYEDLCTANSILDLERTKDGVVIVNTPAGSASSDGNNVISAPLYNWWKTHRPSSRLRFKCRRLSP